MPDAAAAETPAADTAVDVTVYWRPGCGFCMSLQQGLDDLGIAYRGVNIWEDPEGAAFVRQANRGNELVPTVVVAGQVLSNPSPAHVRAALNRAG